MRAVTEAWRIAGAKAWHNLTRLIMLNLLWIVTALPLVTLGPVTLAGYWWTARVVRDEKEEGYGAFFQAIVRFAGRGLIWSLAWLLLLYVAYSNAVVWQRFVPPLLGAVIQIVWLYLLVFALAMQPFLLECLTVDALPWGESLKRSGWAVLANPLYSHLSIPVPALVLSIGLKYGALILVVLVALVLTFLTVVAGMAPRKYGETQPRDGQLEDLF
ncbi:MAG: hypothetical protein ACM3XM_05030 [Mycobacterium leprae]